MDFAFNLFLNLYYIIKSIKLMLLNPLFLKYDGGIANKS